MHLDWKLNSLNDIFSVQTSPRLILLCRFYAADCLVWFRLSLIEQAPSPHRRRWIMLKGSTRNYPKHLGATAETAIGVLINAGPNPPASPPHNTTTTTDPPGRFQDGGIWMWLHVFMTFIISFCWCMTLRLADLCGTCFPRSTRM